jgi:hypothetical protein
VKRALVLAAILALATAAAVFAAGRDGSRAAAPTWFHDVKPIVDGRCTTCHYRGGIAPFALTSYAQVRSLRRAVATPVTHRWMPPWQAAPGVQRYRHDSSLTKAQIATIVRWAAAGAPKGKPSDASPALAAVGAKLSHVDLRLRMPSAYTPHRSDDADDYRCFVLPWAPRATRYLTGVDVQPGEQREVHHIILYLAPPGSAGLLKRWDAADEGAGYGCYGGPSATGSREGLQTPQFLAGWVPGSTGGDFPAGTGIQVPRGARLILQVHYNLDYADPSPDRSAVELSTAPQVAKHAIYVPLVNPLWIVRPATFSIPAGRRSVVHTFAADPRPFAAFLAPGLDVNRGFAIHGVALHMHRLGVSGEIDVERAGGGRERLLSIPRWQFHWQRAYELAKPVDVNAGDRLSIRCRHDNSQAHQPLIRGRQPKPRHVTWGEDSSDEMCIGFLYVTGR